MHGSVLKTVYVMMGVSGCGKTTVGKKLSEKLGLPFYDADDYHSESSIDKMIRGLPLTDVDRYPWLLKLSESIAVWNRADGAVLACSALKEEYRELLDHNGRSKVQYIYLKGSKDFIRKRLKDRKDHYMDERLLDSQFEILEEPRNALVVNNEADIESTVKMIIQKVKTFSE